MTSVKRVFFKDRPQEIRDKEAELASLYASIFKARRGREPIALEDERKLDALSKPLQDFYTNRVVWNSYDEWGSALAKVDFRGMFFHRSSVTVRAICVRKPRPRKARLKRH